MEHLTYQIMSKRLDGSLKLLANAISLEQANENARKLSEDKVGVAILVYRFNARVITYLNGQERAW